MTKILKQSSSAHPLCFLLIDSTDHIAGKTGLSPTVKISKDGVSGVTPAGAVSEIDATNLPGWYKVAGSATDTNTLGQLLLHATATGADPADAEFQVVGFDPDDAAALGLSRIDAAVSSRSTFAGGAVASVTGNVGGNVVGSVASVTAGVTLGNTAHGGAAATLALKTVTVDNTGGSGHAVQVLAATGNGIRVTSSASPAVYAQGGTNSEGLSLLGNGTAAGLRIENAGTQSGILILAGANTGSNADGITAVPNGTGAGFSGTLSADAADSLLDNANGVEAGWTLRQVLRLLAAAMLGKSSNNGNTFRDLNDTKDRIVGTVDASENRTAVTKDAT